MYRLRRSCLAAVLLCLTSANPAAANWQYTRWGMSPAELVAASHGAVHLVPPQRRLGPTGPDIETRAEGTYTDGPLRLDVSFGFGGHGGGLVLVTYLVEDAAQNYLLRQSLVRAHGQPTPTGDADEGSGIWNHPGQDSIDLSISDEGPAFVVQTPSRQSPVSKPR